MTELVIIKSYSNGISIHMMPDVPFSEIVSECRKRFDASAKFFRGAKLAVSFEGRELSFEQEKQLIEAITSVCDIQIVCIVGKDRESEEIFAKGINLVTAEQAASRAQFFKGSLMNGERFETNESVIILGDVAKDGAVVSKKDIIVLGALYGEAYAGIDGKSHFIAALDFYPRRLKIADCKEYQPDRQKRWGRKQKQGPMMAYLSDGHIRTKEIVFTEELLESLSE